MILAVLSIIPNVSSILNIQKTDGIKKLRKIMEKELIDIDSTKENKEPKKQKKSTTNHKQNLKEQREAERELKKKQQEEKDQERKAKQLQKKETFIKLSKRTKKGQPVMKNVIEHLLDKIKSSS